MTDACAFCGAAETQPVQVAPRDDSVMLCATCADGVQNGAEDAPHWKCLNDAIWSTEPAVQVLAWRMLHNLDAAWARDLLDIAYLEPEVMEWAEAGLSTEPEIIHRDSNGAVLSQGDSVVLIKDLPVKGAGFTAKRGTPVRNISLVADNEGHIEGRVEGQRIVILTQFVKKS
ncbi:putative alkylphosphonate utilization operon protein PhnA [Thalassovita gelatinovora]|uniref:Putative alkylphosphonate utilization operon protein PhnA n=1 Tax=Thalassovita gelatinovora TaxID=53501 RepID=A0A0N7LV99_THAGE|nr:PhnA protein [Thalassovita gelatinovora]CUH65706.1 putative alkylphosphonate utilization operon protein PhnA [Thalassovita gelatinovora]SER04680.1 phosphonoacetate hydrolase [Thalassovita gelatinovora]